MFLPAGPQDLPEGQLCRYCFFSFLGFLIFDFWVFAPQGRHIALIKVKFGFFLPNSTLIG